jgi:hypothetical protein
LYLANSNTVVGITSFKSPSLGCGDLPTGFAKVSTYDEWIKKTICAITDVPPTTFACDFCGDGVCDGNEDCTSCSADCGSPCPPDGDGVCEIGESCTTSPADCGSCGTVAASCPAGINAANLALTGIGVAISYKLTVPAGDSIACAIAGGSGDADLKVTLGEFTCESKEEGNVEACRTPGASVSNAAIVEVVAFEPFTGVTLTCTCADFVPNCGDGFCTDGVETCATCPGDCGACPPTCEEGINETGLSARDFDVLSFTLEVAKGQEFQCQTTGNGDLAMYVLLEDMECYSDENFSSAEEVCTSGIATQDGTASIILFTPGSFTGVTLSCTCIEPPTEKPTEKPDGFPFNIPILGPILKFIFSILFFWL